jgi:hypothetical protein
MFAEITIDGRWASAQFWTAAEEHPFPHGFSCGPSRAVGDGLRVLPGAVAGRPQLRASTALFDGDGHRLAESQQTWVVLDRPSLT